MNTKDYEKLGAALHSRAPLLGMFKRRSAVRKLHANRNEPAAIPLLVEALSSQDKVVAECAASAIGQIDSQPARNSLCAHWAETRDNLIGVTISGQGYLADEPLHLAILTKLKCGTAIEPSTPEEISELVARLADVDEAIQSRAESILRSLRSASAREALCAIATTAPRSAAARICVESAYQPGDPEAASVFLLVTRQLEAYFESDDRFDHLRVAYEAAPAVVRSNVLEVVREGDVRLLGFLGGRKSLRQCDEAEIRVFKRCLLVSRDADRLAQAIVELPLRHGLELLAHVQETGRRATRPELRALMERILALAAPLELRSLVASNADAGSVVPLFDARGPHAPVCGEAQTPILQIQHPGADWRSTMSHDGRHIFTSGSDGTMRIWNAEDGRVAIPPLEHGAPIQHLALSPDGTLALTAGKDGTLKVWNVADGSLVVDSIRHSDQINHAEFSPDGSFIVTASLDRSACLWDVATGRQVGEPMQHRRAVLHASFSRSGKRVATASYDLSARIWDGRSAQPLAPPFMHTMPVRFAAFGADENRVVTGCSSQGGLGGGKYSYPLRKAYATSERIVSKCQGTPPVLGAAFVWNDHGDCQNLALPHAHWVNTLKFDEDRTHLLVATGSPTSFFGDAQIFDLRTGEVVGRGFPHHRPVFDACLDENSERVATASADGSAAVWDHGSGRAPKRRFCLDGGVMSVEFCPGGRRLLTSSRTCAATLWDIGDDALDVWPATIEVHDIPALDQFVATAPADKARATGMILREIAIFLLSSIVELELHIERDETSIEFVPA